ncbi:MAG: dicarboxylate/amino acid:cation symporter, partial [Sulfolobales archaeon]
IVGDTTGSSEGSGVAFELALRPGKRPVMMLAATLLGVVAGLVIGEPITSIKFLGDIFLYLLRFVVGPLVFVSIAWAVTTVKVYARLGKIFGGFFIYWLIMGFLAAATGYTMAGILRPGVGLRLEAPPGWTAPHPASAVDVLIGLIPRNVVQPFLELNMLQIIVMALLTGFAISLTGTFSPETKEFLEKLLSAVLAVIYKIVDFILWYAPIGVFSLMSNLVATVGAMGLTAVGAMIVTQWVSYGIVLFVYHPIILAGILKLNPLKYWKKIYPAMLTAFTTCSSSATLPVTMRVTRELGVPADAANLILPIAATINMQAVAAEMPIYAVWVSQMYGVSLGGPATFIALLMGVLGSAACAGIPGGGIMIAAVTMTTLGLPLEPVGWIAGVYTLIDMPNTMLNVTGDPLGTLVVSKLVLKDFDERKYNA